MTAISDGDPALPALVRSAAKAPVESILDWFHLSEAGRAPPRLSTRELMSSGCGTCSGTVSTDRHARLWTGW